MALTAVVVPVAVSPAKVELPVLAGTWVRRERLEERLDRFIDRRLVVIVAPAGHGKTSTVSSWLRTRDIAAAWVSLDDRDTDVTRFAAHVAVAIDRVVPGTAKALFELLTAPDRMLPRDLGSAFGDALYDLRRDAVLVLDDFHVAGVGAVARFVEGLLQSAPRRLHTILTSRTPAPFPLSRYRTSGEVEEIGGADLRFSPDETARFLELESGSSLAPHLAEGVCSAVGGWPAAIRLVAIGQSLGGGVRSPAAGDRSQQLVLDYLAEEVLARLPPRQRHALLAASLVDRFNAPLVAVMVERLGDESAKLDDLGHLRGLELFREIPGLDETWYAYHPLFRNVLRHELERTVSGETATDLRRMAANWFAGAGLIGEAVALYVEAGDIDEAAATIEAHIGEAFAREDWRTVGAWLSTIPIEVIGQRPDLLLASAWVAYLGGRDARITDVIAAMREPRLRDRASVAQMAEVSLLADWPETGPDTWIRTAEAAIAHIPPIKRYRYGYAHLALGMALASAGREDEALARLAAFTDRESARIDAASIRGYFGRTVVLWQTGRLTQCARTAADQLQLAELNDLPVSAGWAAAFAGMVAYEKGDLSRAMPYFELVIRNAERVHFLCVRDVFFGQAMAFETQARRHEADLALARVREIAMSTATRHQVDLVDSVAARIALMRGKLDDARRWLEASSPTLADNDLKSVDHPVLTRAKVLSALGGRDHLDECERLLHSYIALAKATNMRLALIDGLAVLALLSERRGDRDAATRILRESLELAAPESMVQRYVTLGRSLVPILGRIIASRDQASHTRHVHALLIAAYPTESPRPGPRDVPITHAMPSPLSARELDVLRCLARRLTNSEIGEELFISPVTVKNHVAHISDKLDVSGRRAMVARAIELGLLAVES